MNPSFNAYRLAELARSKWYGRRKLAELKHAILIDILRQQEQCHQQAMRAALRMLNTPAPELRQAKRQVVNVVRAAMAPPLTLDRPGPSAPDLDDVVEF